MLAIAFWNVGKGKGGIPPVIALAEDIAANVALSGPQGDLVLCLAEPGALQPAQLLAALQALAPTRAWWCEQSLSQRFICLGTIARASIMISPEASGCLPCTVTRITNAGPQDYQLWFVHLSAPLGTSAPVVHYINVGTNLRTAIEARENAMASGMSLAIGDFNMRPYDEGMTAPQALNAAACAIVAKGRPRVSQGTTYSYFFNPMWELLGSWSPARQPGTFYWNDPNDALRWHLIDQVIVRPPLIDNIVTGTPRIFNAAGGTPLTSPRGVIKKAISDHLPVAISLSI